MTVAVLIFAYAFCVAIVYAGCVYYEVSDRTDRAAISICWIVTLPAMGVAWLVMRVAELIESGVHRFEDWQRRPREQAKPTENGPYRSREP